MKRITRTASIGVVSLTLIQAAYGHVTISPAESGSRNPAPAVTLR